MAGGSRERPTPERIEHLLNRLREAVVREECWTCECLLGYIAQLELDAGAEAGGVFESYKAGPAPMHGCLGCDPCPPAALFAEYLMHKRDL